MQKDETSSSLTKIFDPTIYSMQPLQPNANISSNLDSDTHQRDNSSEESSLIQDDFGRHKISGTDSIDDQSNILSRKTSTASECTTVSDYTPENTITSNAASPPTVAMMQNAMIDSNIGNEQISQPPADNDVSMIDLTVAQNVRVNQINVPSVKDIEAAPPGDNAQRVRKISRFVVSPATITVTNEKINQMQPPTEENATTIAASTQQIPIQIQTGNVIIPETTMPTIPVNFNAAHLIANAPAMFAANPQLSGEIAQLMSTVQAQSGNTSITPNEILSQSQPATEFLQQHLKKPLDHINTLEQLKIELENITHGHMIFNLPNPNQISPEMLMQQQMEQIPVGMIDSNGQLTNEYYQQQMAQQQNALAMNPSDVHVDHATRNLSQQNSLETVQDQALVE